MPLLCFSIIRNNGQHLPGKRPPQPMEHLLPSRNVPRFGLTPYGVPLRMGKKKETIKKILSHAVRSLRFSRRRGTLLPGVA